jgi:hypothetical protein
MLIVVSDYICAWSFLLYDKKNPQMKHNYLFKILLIQILVIAFIANVGAISHKRSCKKILIEKFTGIHCGFCPNADEIAGIILEAQPDSAYVISVHTGYYAAPMAGEPDLRYVYGDSLYDGNDGYPAGSLNRKCFDGASSDILNRSDWIKKAKLLSTEFADINLEIKGEIDSLTRNLKVSVKGYYTGDEAMEPIYFHLALVENNIKGPQNGGNKGNNYIHNHVLRELITGLDGDSIGLAQAGDVFDREYAYTIPQAYHSILAKLQDMEVVVFATQGKKGEILNLEGIAPEFRGFHAPLKATLSAIDLPKQYGLNYFPVGVKSETSDTIRSLKFNVSINGSPQVVDCLVQIPPFSYKKLKIKVNPYAIAETNDYVISLEGINGIASVSQQALSGSFNEPFLCSSRFILEFKTDNYGDENKIEVKDREGKILHTFGPFLPNYSSVKKDTVQLGADGIYLIELSDRWGDGVLSPRGYFKLRSGDGTLLAQNLEIGRFGASFAISAKNTSGIESDAVQPPVLSLHRDTQTGKTTIKVNSPISGKASIEVYDLLGKCAASKTLEIDGNTATWEEVPISSSGIYIVCFNQGVIRCLIKSVLK